MFKLENVIEKLMDNKEVLAKYIMLLDVDEYYDMCTELFGDGQKQQKI